MKLQKFAGATSEIWQLFIQDSSSTVGAGLTGITSSSAGLTAYYHRDTDTTATVISSVGMTVGTYTSGGFKEIDSTNMPGWYQFCPPNASLASGAKSCAFHLKGFTNMAPLPIEVQLTTVNPDSAAFGLSIAKTTNITGFNDIAAPTGFAAATFPTGTIANTTNITAGTISNVGTLTTYTGNTPQTGDAFLRLGAPAGASTAADIAAINTKTTNLPASPASTTNITAGTITTVTNLTNAPTAGDLTAAMKTSVKTQAVDALNTDTYAEPAQGAPGATITLAAKIGFLYKAWRNKTTQTATVYSLLNDDAVTVDHKAAVADDGTTFSRGEIATGP